mgnify:CR=1 FL=1
MLAARDMVLPTLMVIAPLFAAQTLGFEHRLHVFHLTLNPYVL